MQSILDKNIESLKQENQDIADFLLHSKLECQDIEAGVESISGRKILYVIKEDKQYQLDSLYDEKWILDIWHSQFKNQNYRSRYLLFGLGNGMYVRKLLENIEPEAVIIVVEPSAVIFSKVMEEFDISDILGNEQVHLLVEGISESRFRDSLGQFLEPEDVAGATLRSYLNYPVLFPQEHKRFKDEVQFYVNRMGANELLMQRMGVDYVGNTIINYPFMAEAKSLIDLNRKLPKDIPAIIVSAGPSLDKNIEILKKAKNRSFILAVDAAVKALIKHDIIPDAMISIDAWKVYKHFNDPQIQDIPLIMNPHSSRWCSVLHKGDKYLLQDGNQHLKSIFDKFNKMVVEIDSGGSVATSAFALLERLQFKTIILVGQDLAYTDNRTHSAGTVRGERNENIYDKDTLEVEDINGDMVTSSYEFQIYQDWFEEEIRTNSESKYKVIDATQGGAKIKGTIIKTLSEAIKEECQKTVDMDAVMKSVVCRLTESEKEIFKSDMLAIPEQLMEKKNIVKKGIRNYEKMLQLVLENRYHAGEVKRLFEKTNQMLETVENSPVYYYVWCYSFAKIAEDFDYDLYAGEEEEKAELKLGLEQAIHYCRTVETKMEECINQIKHWLEIAEDDKLRCYEAWETSGMYKDTQAAMLAFHIEGL